MERSTTPVGDAVLAVLKPKTPPTDPARGELGPSLQMTPEKVKRMELNRLKAKARQRELREKQAASAEPSTLTNANNKRPLEVTSALSKSPTGPHKRSYERKEGEAEAPLKRNSRLSNYYEYDLSKMVNSKGGFLVDEDGGNGREIDEETRRLEQRREKERVEKNAEPLRSLDPSLNPKCRECNSMDVDHIYRVTFRCSVCNSCKNTYPEKYSLLTKTECKEDYLLTDPELRDEEELPNLLRPNPHSSTWNNMMLYIRYQVEEFAWKKWGSPEALDAEFYRREEDKKRKRGRKFEEGLRDLRRRTKEGIWQQRQDEKHVHAFGAVEKKPKKSRARRTRQEDESDEDGVGIQRCGECGFTIEVEVF